MTDRDALLRRIEALLHHPPELALTLAEKGKHRQDARVHLQRLLSDAYERQHLDEIKAANRIASGANEYNFPGQKSGDPFRLEWQAHPVLRHPLSGIPVNIDLGTVPDADALRQTVNGVLLELAGGRALKDLSEDDLERLALALWRDLPDRLAGQAGLGMVWHLLPSETRIPDHPVWEHLSLTAALATASIGPAAWPANGRQPSSAALLLFTIGPVQGFIGAARKTRDLQAGSFLLSYLTWQAIRCVCERFGPEAVLFPDLRDQPLVDHWLTKKKGLQLHKSAAASSAATIPNRFFAVVPFAGADSVAGEAEKAVRGEFERIGKKALEVLKGKIRPRGSRVDWTTYERQIYNYFECYWTVLPLRRIRRQSGGAFKDAFASEYDGFFDWKDDAANDILDAFDRHQTNTNVGAVYGRLYRLTEALTGSRKALRNFDPVQESGFRCSLIPSLPAIVPTDPNDPEGTPSTRDVRRFWEHAARRLKPSFLREGEQLSAVALAKRFLPDYISEDDTPMPDGSFPSTGSFATADFKADVIAVLTGKRLLGNPMPDPGKVEVLRKALDRLRSKLQPLSDAFSELTEAALPKLRSLLVGDVEDDKWKRLVKKPDEHLAWLAALDGGWLFADGYDAKQIAKEYGFEKTTNGSETYYRAEGDKTFTKAQVKDAREALGAFIDAATKADIAPPSKYYAVLQMDGDEMGKWLSGQKAPLFRDALHPNFIEELKRRHNDQNIPEDYKQWVDLIKGSPPRPLTPALHLAISRALGVFALQLVPRLTEEEHLAQRVYSGGDDVLAFASFRDALPLARRLRAAFSGQVREEEQTGEAEQPLRKRLEAAWESRNGYVQIDGALLPTMGHTATASTGVVIAHYKQSLQHVFREAHTACEDYAKDTLKRNALAITVLKRSGERFQTGTPWHTTTGEGMERCVAVRLAEALEHYADLVREGWVASGYLYDLGVEARGLSVFEMERKPDDGAHEAVTRAAYQLFQRRTERLTRLRLTDLPEGHWLHKLMREEATKPEEEQKKPQRLAFETTVGRLLDHNPLDRLISLLDAAQFLGQGGDR